MNTKKFGIMLIGLMLVVGLLFAVVPAGKVSAATTIYVDDNFDASTPGWGVTHFATIQAAYAVAISGDTINVAAGNYFVPNPFTISKDLTIVGEDKSTTIIKAANYSWTYWWTLDTGRTVNLSGVTIDGEGIFTVIIDVLSGGIKTIDDNIIKNTTTTGYAIFGESGSNSVISSNVFSNTGYDGIYMIGTSTITGNTFTGRGTGNWLEYGITVAGGGNATITGNTMTNFLGVTTGTLAPRKSAGIVVSTDWYPTLTATATITNNNFTDNTVGLYVGAVYDADKSTVTATGNTFEDNDFQVEKNAVSTTINFDVDAAFVNNTFDNSAMVQGGAIIYPSIQQAIDVAVTGNTLLVGPGSYYEHVMITKPLTLTGASKDTTIIDGGGTTGIIVQIYQTSGVTVSGFTVQNSGIDLNADGGIGLILSTGCTITNNIVQDNSTGIGLLGSSGNSISNNTLDQNARYGIVLDQVPGQPTLVSPNNTLTGNTITGSGRDGIYVGKDSHGQTITNNTISGATGTTEGTDFEGNGVYLWKSRGNTISGNAISDNITYGIEMMGSNNNAINNNIITGNTLNGIIIRSSGYPEGDYPSFPNQIGGNNISGNSSYEIFADSEVAEVNASGNWFGVATPAGVKAEISGNVDYTPWLAVGTDTSTDPGFQGDFSTLWVDDDSPQTGTVGRIQEGINLVSGSTVNVAAGTYNEINILINKSLTLIGDPGDANAGPGVNAPVIDGGSAYGDAIKLANGVSNVAIKGFEIRNYASNDTGVGNAISAWVGSTVNITVADNYFHHLEYNGVLVGNDKNSDPTKWGDHTGWLIKDNIIENFGYIGFELTNTSSSTIEENIIHMSTPYIGAIFSSARRSESGLDIKNNVIDGTQSTAYPVIYIYAYSLDMANPNFDDIYIAGNTISSTGTTYHIYVRNILTGTVTNVVVEENKLTSLKNLTSQQVDATHNYWGTACAPTNISGDVAFSPWYVDSAMTTTASTPTTAGLYIFPAGSTTLYMNAIIACAPNGSTFDFTGNTVGGIFVGPAQQGLKFFLNGNTVGAGSPAFTIEGDDITIQGPGVLDGDGSTDPSIWVKDGADNFALDSVEVREWANGIQVSGIHDSFKLVSNWIHDNVGAGLLTDVGMEIDIDSITTIEGNLFKENGGPGINHNGTGTLLAEYNSWGDIGGPLVGVGDGISGSVDYTPWTYSEVFVDMVPDTLATQATVNENGTFSIAVKVDAEKLYAVSYKLTYNTAYLQLLNLVDGTFKGTYGGCMNDTSTDGVVIVTCYRISPDLGVDNANGETISTLTFQAAGMGLIDNGPWQTYIDLSTDTEDLSSAATGGIKVFVNNGGFGAPSSEAGHTITDTDDGKVIISGLANFSGYIDLEGRANDSGATITVYNQATIAGATAYANGTSTSSGKYTTAYLSAYQLTVPTEYWFQVDARLYLPVTALEVSPSYPTLPTVFLNSGVLATRSITSLLTVQLLGGDANDNNAVDASDLGCLGGAYGKPAEACGSGSSDVNGDGKVDIYDLVLLGGNYDKTSSNWTQ